MHIRLNDFEEQLINALRQYSSDNIDIVFESETNEYLIIYHSRHDSFPIFVANKSSLIYKNSTCIWSWMVGLANKYNVGYCL